MAIPLAAVSPFMVAAVVLWKTEHWSNGALGSVYLGLIGIAVVVGSFMVPLGSDTQPQRPRRRR
jgi:hypothetical protein